MNRPLVVPGASAEAFTQEAVKRLAAQAAIAGAQYCTLSHRPQARRFTGDVENPMSERNVSSQAVALANAVALSSGSAHLPGRVPAPTAETA